jgi:hypothetical protein
LGRKKYFLSEENTKNSFGRARDTRRIKYPRAYATGKYCVLKQKIPSTGDFHLPYIFGRSSKNVG